MRAVEDRLRGTRLQQREWRDGSFSLARKASVENHHCRFRVFPAGDFASLSLCEAALSPPNANTMNHQNMKNNTCTAVAFALAEAGFAPLLSLGQLQLDDIVDVNVFWTCFAATGESLRERIHDIGFPRTITG